MDKYAKAVVAATIAGLAALAPALVDGSVTATEWVMVAAAFFGALSLTWAVPNAPNGGR